MSTKETTYAIKITLEVDPDRHEVWFRVYDTRVIRDLLVPGTRVSLSGFVSKYESSGGYTDFEGDFISESDRFQLSTGRLELVEMDSLLEGAS